MAVQSEAAVCAHVNSSTAAQQLQLRSHAQTGRAIASASHPLRGVEARRALVQQYSHGRPRHSEGKPGARSSRDNCTLADLPGVFGSSCDMLCYGHVTVILSLHATVGLL